MLYWEFVKSREGKPPAVMLYSEFLKNDHRECGKWVHYFPIYERHFSRFKGQYFTLFEIGVREGGSLQLWQRYFGPNVQIVGIDITEECRKLAEDHIHIRIGSQADTDFLASLIAEFGVPDIVIDDGSHMQSHIMATFNYLYPKMPKNGIYVAEDLQTAYDPEYEGGLRRPGTFIERTKDFIDELNAKMVLGAQFGTPEGNRTDSIHVYDGAVVFEVGEPRLRYTRWVGNKTI
jgi:hypothetical protein